jgi:hypothetical protein
MRKTVQKLVREIVGGEVDLREKRRPGQQQNRNGHDTTGGYRSQKSFHCRHIIHFGSAI